MYSEEYLILVQDSRLFQPDNSREVMTEVGKKRRIDDEAEDAMETEEVAAAPPVPVGSSGNAQEEFSQELLKMCI